MKKILAVVTVAVVSMFLVADLVPQAQAATVNTEKGTKNLLFQFSGLSTMSLGTYKGGVGMRWYMQNNMAVRPMIMFGMSSSKNPKALTSGGFERKTSDTSLGAELTLEKHMTAVGPVSPYIGGQVGVSYNQTKITETGTGAGPELKNTTMDFGLGVVGGFEWGFTEGVTLGGEYSVGASLGSGKTQRAGTDTGKTSRTQIGIGTASLFLSVAWM